MFAQFWQWLWYPSPPLAPYPLLDWSEVADNRLPAGYERDPDREGELRPITPGDD